MSQFIGTRRGFVISIAILVIALGAALVLVANAQEVSIEFPVAELGNCADEQSCRAYCDEPENISACVAFAKQNGLMNEEEATEAEQFAAAMASGNTPGGCTNEESCHQYCENVEHIEECLAFAGDNGMMDPQEKEEALKVAAALKRGVKLPAGCNSKQSCEETCSNPDNMEMCITFAQEAGLMSGQELEESQKMLAAIKKGVKPPACGGKNACDAYCQEESHFEECLNFAEAAGFMSAEDAAMARKTGGKGPGGCKREECKTYCENPDNQEVCTKFAIENGLMSAEDQQRMNEGRQEMAKGFDRATPEIQECLKAAIGEEKLNQIREGSAFPTQAIGEKMRSCFDQFSSQMGPPPGESGQYQGPPPGEGGEYNGERRGPPEMMGRPPEGFNPSQISPEYQEKYRQYQEGNIPPEYQQQFQEQRQQMEQQYQQEYQQNQEDYRAPSSEESAPSGDSGSGSESSGDSSAAAPYSPGRDMASLLWIFLGLFQ
ncbi:MAG: hypothetical protein Q7R62_01925 [bacterium]|nr:hypothetical protein [bacterium]